MLGGCGVDKFLFSFGIEGGSNFNTIALAPTLSGEFTLTVTNAGLDAVATTPSCISKSVCVVTGILDVTNVNEALWKEPELGFAWLIPATFT
jgi:hypothetical protein